MRVSEIRYGEAGEVANFLEGDNYIDQSMMLSALINALDRIDKLEKALAAKPRATKRKST